ncbi:MAG TPA: sigma-54-dependent Fis family transcriptional regulator, partial [Candidatus Eisenbacteria bacterium]|nr:sigma-54-dependent Fis family transcriptional regulator [Candidatus Eisenbacteria bacterium]
MYAFGLEENGAYRRAERLARRALELAERRGWREERLWCRVELGRALAARQRWSEVAALAGAGRGDDPGMLLPEAWLNALDAEAALNEDRAERVSDRLGQLEDFLMAHPAPHLEATAEMLRAALALALHRVPEGTERAARALERFGRLPAPADRAQAALTFARKALAGGPDARAPVGAWLETAAEAYGRLGNVRGRERALALTVAWLNGRLAQAPRPHDSDLLEQVSRLLHALPDPSALTRKAMHLLVEQVNADRGVLLLMDAATGRLEPMAEYGAMDPTTRREAVGYSRQFVERVAAGGNALLVTDAAGDPSARSDSVTAMRLRSILCVPMYLGGRMVGAVYLDSQKSQAFTEADRRLLDGFAHLMAVAIDSSRGQEEVRRANLALEAENRSLREGLGTRYRPASLVGSSQAMLGVLSKVERAAGNNVTVMLTGENGTGKELIARTMHLQSRRRLGPFVTVNCGAIPEALLESELFGIEGHVATGVRAREGTFVQAHGGTLFLDEVAEMPLRQQVALLGVLANREVMPVGGRRPIPVDVRVIAATNRDLAKRVAEGGFREDLYYRLNVLPIEVPPLRARKADIPALARHFAAQVAEQHDRVTPELSDELLAVIMQSDWPGNVRELQNYIERLMALQPGSVLLPNPLPQDLADKGLPIRGLDERRLPDMIVHLERKAISEALRRWEGNQSRAARELGLSEQAIRYKMRKYRLRAR